MLYGIASHFILVIKDELLFLIARFSSKHLTFASHLLSLSPSQSKPPVWKVFKHCQTSKHANSHIKCVISPTEIKAKHMQLFGFVD